MSENIEECRTLDYLLKSFASILANCSSVGQQLSEKENFQQKGNYFGMMGSIPPFRA